MKKYVLTLLSCFCLSTALMAQQSQEPIKGKPKTVQQKQLHSEGAITKNGKQTPVINLYPSQENTHTASATSSLTPGNRNNPQNFVAAAKLVSPAVVHVRTVYESPSSNFYNPFLKATPLQGSGSGVIIDASGFIATNNHVVENATKIEVVLPDKRNFTARLMGWDANTDLALLKIDANNLPVVHFGNSDSVQIGEWVLAVGYPYSLNTTVTAGIISAKGRSIGIIESADPSKGPQQESMAIESFLQTDAPINPGNSGGALINTNGDLIGINTAIASSTGSYAGYAFAIPASLVKKVTDDLKTYGKVKRGILGVSFPSPVTEEQYFLQQGISPATVHGVFITGVQNNSAALQAGLQEGDVIQYLDGVEMQSPAEFSERIARHRPGDKVEIGYLRNGKLEKTTAVLQEEETRSLATSDSLEANVLRNKLGASFAPLSASLKKQYGIGEGVLVTDVVPGGFFEQMGVPKGAIIIQINRKKISNVDDIDKALLATGNKRLQILCIAPDGSRIAINMTLGA